MLEKKLSFILLLLPVLFLTAIAISALSEKYSGEELPVFMQKDTIAGKNGADIEVEVLSKWKCDSGCIEIFKKDYLNIWSHLNHLYGTNDIEAGKEYYTEAWFDQIEKNFKGKTNVGVRRSDIRHRLKILTLSTDNLVCTVQDTVDLQLQTITKKTTYRFLVHMAILFQGDHWRIDAIDFEALDHELLNN